MEESASTFKKRLIANKFSLILILALVILIAGIGLLFHRVLGAITTSSPTPAPEISCNDPLPNEVDLPFDDTGPYAVLSPRRDGNALVLDIRRVSDYNLIYYELTYQSDGIDRGVCGFVRKSGDANANKSEYSQEILFGTCSKGDTFSTLHCVFDKDVHDGVLTLHVQSGDKAYKMVTTWHLQEPDIDLGVITSGDGHFTYKTSASQSDLSLSAYTIVNDLTGLPKLLPNTQVIGKAYSFNVPDTRTFPQGQVSIELPAQPLNNERIAYYDDINGWKQLDTKINGNILTAPVDHTGIFAVLAPKSSGKTP